MIDNPVASATKIESRIRAFVTWHSCLPMRLCLSGRCFGMISSIAKRENAFCILGIFISNTSSTDVAHGLR